MEKKNINSTIKTIHISGGAPGDDLPPQQTNIDDGKSDNGSSVDNLSVDDLSTDDGGEGDGSEGDGSEGDGSEGDGSEGDGSEGDGSEGDGSEGDGSEGVGSEGDDSEGGEEGGGLFYGGSDSESSTDTIEKLSADPLFLVLSNFLSSGDVNIVDALLKLNSTLEKIYKLNKAPKK